MTNPDPNPYLTVNEMIAKLQAIPEGMRNETVYIELSVGFIAPIVTVEYNPSFAAVVAQYPIGDIEADESPEA